MQRENHLNVKRRRDKKATKFILGGAGVCLC